MNKRRWFQIHLSTTVVTILVVGGLLGMNIRQLQIKSKWKSIGHENTDLWPRQITQPNGDSPLFMMNTSGQVWESHEQMYYGWPFRFWTIGITYREFRADGGQFETEAEKFDYEIATERWYPKEEQRWYPTAYQNLNTSEIRGAIIKNIIVVIFVCLVIVLACEWRIRRKEN